LFLSWCNVAVRGICPCLQWVGCRVRQPSRRENLCILPPSPVTQGLKLCLAVHLLVCQILFLFFFSLLLQDNVSLCFDFYWLHFYFHLVRCVFVFFLTESSPQTSLNRRSSGRQGGVHELSAFEQLVVELVRHDDSWPFMKLVSKIQVTDRTVEVMITFDSLICCQ